MTNKKARPTCGCCGKELICAHCVGKRAVKKSQKEHGIKAYREWGKLGGRPRKTAVVDAVSRLVTDAPKSTPTDVPKLSTEKP